MSKEVDPVCKMEVDTESAPAKASYKGKTYFFCMKNCKKVFSRNPEKYIQSEKGEACCTTKY